MPEAAAESIRELDERFIPAVEMVERTGAKGFQIRWCEEEEPTVWFAMATYDREWRGEHRELHEVAAAMDPVTAVFRLCESLMDGGQCRHCHRPTGFIPDLKPTLADKLICWYQWDPELKTFRRGCEGDVPRRDGPNRAERRKKK